MAPQDTFIDEEDDTCPLCVEEFDLSDRNFRPCPCGYQICQFCFNNIKQNMNGLCPACRRPYDEKSIQWKVVTQEEIAEFRSNIQKNQKKRAAEQRQKEAQKREAEKENRKNLVGVRVVQKNLVYVTGLNPTVREDELLKTLRKQEFFGQYGNIQKISISNRKSPDGSPSLGIYVTFEKKEEAQRCIQAVNGSMNGDRTLKAQLGTTKYCSAWLRHEQCTNRQCMFLHELGDEEDSYTRQDLSSMNSINTQRPLNATSSSRSASRQQSHPVPAQPPASQPMVRSSSKDESENGDASALPLSANWARNPQVRSRRGSHATSGAAPSPAISMSLPVTAESVAETVESSPTPEEAVPATSRAQAKAPADNTSSAGSAASSKSATAPTTKKDKDPLASVFTSLLQAMEKCTLPSTFLTNGLSLDAYPPLFDPRGGEKRRALRDDESRLDTEQEDPQTEAREPSEGEPESSGSLALGGEPEDREHSRSGHAFDQRRGGPPPPIQRSNTDSLFSSFGSSYLPNANPGTIGNRSITPQQPLYSRTPSGFADHAPPGIGSSQSALFQGQAHSRQPSRYGFANENVNSGATTIKLAANPRIMAQQSSMMPPSLHSQQNTPYYAASMPGPPPGLKSTGTPPAMFGHGFANSGFGGAPKDTSQLLQDIIRGRGGAGSQAHDAGKREYMFPSFLSQYPSSSGSSTPVPAPGFSASLYGTPPGAFQDIGSKQKKKGKKHRHANTSSSGGSGLVDLADPSILQARLPHQQSNAGVGQGLFGGQAQGDELSGLDDVISTVDALVADEPGMPLYPYGIDSPLRSGTPSFPPGFGHVIQAHPTPPPGFGRPMTPVSVAASADQVASKPLVPAVPLELLSVKRTLEQPEKKATRVASSSGADTKKNVKAENVPLSQEVFAPTTPVGKLDKKKVLQDEDFPALDGGTFKAAAAASSSAHPPKVLSVSKPSTPVGKKIAAAEVPSAATATSGSAAALSRSATPTKESKKADKRPVPAVLNIAAATKAIQSKPAGDSPAGEKGTADLVSAFPSLPTPSAAASAATAAPAWSPVIRSAPKTLRVVQTPKIETAPVLSVAAVTAAEAAAKAPNRPAAVVTNRPGTPASEIISDNASVVSASISASRAGSPPPSRIGSANVRATTKSQQRKQRKQASKKEAVTVTSQPVPEQHEEEEIAPILGRKKKQKKEKPSGTAPTSSAATPVESRESTPTPSAGEAPAAVPLPLKDQKKQNEQQQQQSRETAAPQSSKQPAVPVAGVTKKKEESKEKTSAVVEGKLEKAKVASKSSAGAAAPSAAEVNQKARDKEEEELQRVLEEAAEVAGTSSLSSKAGEDATINAIAGTAAQTRAGPTIYDVAQDMVARGLLPSVEDMPLLKPYIGIAHRAEVREKAIVGDALLPPEVIFTEDDRVDLLAGKVVRKVIDGVRLMVTPNGDCLRNLTEEEENRFLALQTAVSEAAASPLGYLHPRYETTGGFALISKRAVPSGMPGYFPPSPGTQQVDPVTKIQREEAVYWINQYVLPRLNLLPQSESASWQSMLADTGMPQAIGTSTVAPWIYHTPEMRNGGVNHRDGGGPTLDADYGMEDYHHDHHNHYSHDHHHHHHHHHHRIDSDDDELENSVRAMSVEDAEMSLAQARKDVEKFEKALNQLIKKNRRILLTPATSGSGGAASAAGAVSVGTAY